MTRELPHREDQDKVLGHADEADGIEEYDNKLPAWWLGIFYVSIVGGTAYGIDYHFVSHRSQAGAYDAEVALAKERWPVPVAPATVALTADALTAGKQLYDTNCVGCHGPELQGLIGPNLTDDAWIRGAGQPADVVEIVTNGSPLKGMPTWGPILGPEKVNQVVAFVLSRHGKTGS
jgi:cytochrome c oxidase cbb3-type subunit III